MKYAIYHSADLDGITCAALAKIKFPDINLVGYDYGQPLDEIEAIPDGSEVYMMDISLKVDDMMELGRRCNFIWIDHHKSVINELVSTAYYMESTNEIGKTDIGILNKLIFGENSQIIIKCYCEVGRAACELAMEFFGIEEKVRLSNVLYIGRYDTWRKDRHGDWEENILPFQFGIRAYVGLDVNKMVSYLTNQLESTEYIRKLGRHILHYQREQARIVMQNSFKCTLSVTPENESAFEGEEQFDCIAVNSMGLNTDLLPSEIDIQGLVFLQFIYQKDDTWRISMRSEGDLDVGELSSMIGGGGHKNAAGCIMQLGEKMEGFWEFKSLHKKSPRFLTLELYA